MAIENSDSPVDISPLHPYDVITRYDRPIAFSRASAFTSSCKLIRHLNALILFYCPFWVTRTNLPYYLVDQCALDDTRSFF